MHSLQENEHVPLKTLFGMIIHILQMYLRHKKQTKAYNCGMPTKKLVDRALYTSHTGSPWFGMLDFETIHDNDGFETGGGGGEKKYLKKIEKK